MADKIARLRSNLQNLERIAKESGWNNRAFGFPGYKASVDFVLGRAQTLFADSIDAHLQPFNYTFETTWGINVTGPDGKAVYVVSPSYNQATPLPAGITAELVYTSPDNGTLGKQGRHCLNCRC